MLSPELVQLSSSSRSTSRRRLEGADRHLPRRLPRAQGGDALGTGGVPARAELDQPQRRVLRLAHPARPHLDSKAMLPRAVKELVAYTPGTAFYGDGDGRQNIRLSFCYPTPEQIRVGIRRLANVHRRRARAARHLRRHGEPLAVRNSDRDSAAHPPTDLRLDETDITTKGLIMAPTSVSTSSCSPAGSRTSATSRCAAVAASPTACTRRTPCHAPSIRMRRLLALPRREPSRRHLARPPRSERRGRRAAGAARAARASPSSAPAATMPPARLVEADREGTRRPRGCRHAGSITLPKETFRELGAADVLASVSRLGLPSRREARRRAVRRRASRSSRSPQSCRAPWSRRTPTPTSPSIERNDHGNRGGGRRHRHGRRRPRRFPPSRSSPLSGVYSFDARYNAGETLFYTPARLVRRCRRRESRRPPWRTIAAPPASAVAHRPDRRRGGRPVVPRGERAARAHRDIARAAGDRGLRAGTSATSTQRWLLAAIADA